MLARSPTWHEVAVGSPRLAPQIPHRPRPPTCSVLAETNMLAAARTRPRRGGPYLRGAASRQVASAVAGLPDAEGGDAAVVRPGTRLWHRHPAVSSQESTFGEKAADWLKHWFLGTWIALGLVTLWIATWIALQRTSISWDLYPFILL